MSSNIGSMDLNYVPSTTPTIFLKSGEGCFSVATENDSRFPHLELPICSDLFQANGSINDQFEFYSHAKVIKDLTGSYCNTALQVVPKSILDNVENHWKFLIDGTKRLIQNQISTLNDIFKLNVLGVGLITGSAIGLHYTNPEHKKTRMGLQALFVAGLSSVAYAAFKAHSSINLLQKI